MTLVSVSYSEKAQIYVAADDRAAVYLNGELLAKTYDWPNFVNYSLNVNVGDVIAVEATDLGGGYGVVAALVSGSKQCVTKKGKEPWRAVKSSKVRNKDWKCKGFDSSLWPLPMPASFTETETGAAINFPYKSTKAQYVWARRAGERSTVALRLVVTRDCV